MRRYPRLATILGLTIAMGLARPAAGAVKPGDLIVTDYVDGTVDDVNPITGASFAINQGFVFSNPK
jgi:hypothetical protein